MNVTFYIATQLDVDALTALVNSAYRGDSSRAGWTTEADLLGGQRTDAARMAATIAAADSCIIVAEHAGALIACVQLDRLPGGVYIGLLTVSPTLQNAGVGKQLLAHAEESARENWQARYSEMTVISVRASLIAWYERRGYAITSERRPFPAHDPRCGLPQQPLEFLVMRKEL